jgi:hypothetical protein
VGALRARHQDGAHAPAQQRHVERKRVPVDAPRDRPPQEAQRALDHGEAPMQLPRAPRERAEVGPEPVDVAHDALEGGEVAGEAHLTRIRPSPGELASEQRQGRRGQQGAAGGLRHRRAIILATPCIRPREGPPGTSWCTVRA